MKRLGYALRRFVAVGLMAALLACDMPLTALGFGDIAQEQDFSQNEEASDKQDIFGNEDPAQYEVQPNSVSENERESDVTGSDEEEVCDELVENQSDSDLNPYPRYSGGNGTEENPFLIASYADLVTMREYSEDRDAYVNHKDAFPSLYEGGKVPRIGYYRLTTDIYFPSTDPWKAIYNPSFVLCFDGDGHTLYNMVLEADEEYASASSRNDPDNRTSLFGANTGTIKNLNISDVTIRFPKLEYAEYASCTAYIFAQSCSNFEGCSLKGTTKIVNENSVDDYSASVYLMTGRADRVTDCSIEGTVNAENIKSITGICGALKHGETIRDCNVNADITMNGGSFTGILSGGYSYSGKGTIKIEHCTLEGRIVNYDLKKGTTVCEGNIIGILKSGGSGTFLISDCVNRAEIYSFNAAAGFSTYIRNGDTIKDCVNEGNINSLKQVAAGFVLTSMDGTLENCLNTGTIQGNMNSFQHDWYSSGICSGNAAASYSNSGGAATNVIGCVNEGEVKGYLAAGIYGMMAETVMTDGIVPIIEKCENRGKITGVKSAGGIVGSCKYRIEIRRCKNSGMIIGQEAGGIAGLFKGNMAQCANRGDISCVAGSKNNSFVGGLAGTIGYNGTISDCYNAGEIKNIYDYSNVGGLFGRTSSLSNADVLEIENCYSVTKLSGKPGTTAGGIGGQLKDDSISFTRCHYLTNSKYAAIGSTGTDTGISANTDDELKKQDTYSSWDFDDIWMIGAEDGYPYPVFRFDGIEITFDCNGGKIGDKELLTKNTSSNGRISSLPWPIYRGMKFLGWFSDAEGGEEITRSTVFTEPKTVYAHWEVNPNWGIIAISEQSPAAGAHALIPEDYLTIRFQTEEKVVINESADAGYIHIYLKDSGEELLTDNIDREVSITDRWLGSLVKVKVTGLKLSTSSEYVIVIDDNWLVGEDDHDKFVTVDYGDWCFSTGARVKYRDEKKKADVEMPYIFDWSAVDFSKSSFEYNWELSMIAYGMTLSAFESYEKVKTSSGQYGVKNAENFLVEGLHFNKESFKYNEGYNYPPKRNTIGVCAASKKIDVEGEEYTFIAVPIRGAGYEAEWASNVKVGIGATHEGFEDAASQVIQFLRNYIEDCKISGKVKILITGYSRAGGTTNLVAAKIDKGALDDISGISLDKKDVYGFCFEPPATTTLSEARDENKFGNIYSFMNYSDVVPKIPAMAGWGFTHYGRELYYPDQFTGSKLYYNMWLDFDQKYHEYTGQWYDDKVFVDHCNTAGNLRTWLDLFTNDLCQTVSRADYWMIELVVWDLAGEYGRDDFGWDNVIETILFGLLTAGTKTGNELLSHYMYFNDIEKFLDTGRRIFKKVGYHSLNYSHDLPLELKGALCLYLTFTDNPFFQEHEPMVNFTWHSLCGDLDPAENLTPSRLKYVLVNCPVDVKVYDAGTGSLVAQIVDGEEWECNECPVEAFVDNNGQKVFVVPENSNWNIEIKATDEGSVNVSVMDYNESEGFTRKMDFAEVAVSKGDELNGAIVDGTCELVDKNGMVASEFQNEITYYNIEAEAEELGTVSGQGKQMKNSFVELQALPDPGASFVGWYEEGSDNLISDESEFRFKVTEDRRLVAKFAEIDGVTAAAIDDQTYIGKALKPGVRLYDGVKALVLNKQYTVSYKNNTNAYPYTDEDYKTWEETGKAVAPHDGTVGFDPKKAPKAVIKMKGDYKGTKTLYFKILPPDIEGKEFDAADIFAKYTGKKQTPQPVLLLNGKKLKLGKDFIVPEITASKQDAAAFKGQADADTVYTLTLVGSGNYTGSRQIRYTICGNKNAEGTTQILMKDVKVASIPAQPYPSYGMAVTMNNFVDKKGNPYTPSVSIKNGKNTIYLKENVDYSVSYKNNVSVGTATMTLTGLQNADSPSGLIFVGSKSVTFKINGRNFSKVKISLGSGNYIYSGEAQTPGDVTLSWVGEGDLVEDKDYTVTVQNNVNAGTATMVFTGMGLYTGTQKKTFRIAKKSLSTPAKTHSEEFLVTNEGSLKAEFVKGGAQLKPEIVWKHANRNGEMVLETLQVGRDYTLKYANNKKIWSDGAKPPKVTVTGTGNFSGSFSLQYSITPTSLTSLAGRAYVPDKEVGKKVGAWCATPVIIDSDGKTLKAGTDFEVSSYALAGSWDLATGDIVLLPEADQTPLEKTSAVEEGDVICVKVTGKGNYGAEDSVLTMYYRILENGHDISKAKFTIGNKAYTGRAVKLSAEDITKATLPGKTENMVFGTDYEVIAETYINNVKRGTAQVTLRGKGAYGGTKTVQFKIGTRNLEDGIWKGILRMFFGR